jgi:hypothetical protein
MVCLLWACENFGDLKAVRRNHRCSSALLQCVLYEQWFGAIPEQIAPPARVELATLALGKPCSIQLSYGGGESGGTLARPVASRKRRHGSSSAALVSCGFTGSKRPGLRRDCTVWGCGNRADATDVFSSNAPESHRA